jgi:hypothetical protein
LNIPADVPAKDFWPIVVYDPQKRSQLQTGQPFPAKNNERHELIANGDGSVDLYFGPAGVSRRDSGTLAPNQPEAGNGRRLQLWTRVDQRPRHLRCRLAKPLRKTASQAISPPRPLGGDVREPRNRWRLQPTWE